MDRTVGELGEFGLIAAVTARLPQGAAVLLGPGDDAAVIRAADGRVVTTTDLLVEGRHFRRDWSSAYEIGRKAAAANLADVAAMGAVPTVLLVGLAAPAALSVDWALLLADGLREECALVGASVAGGDVARAENIMVAVTALGDLQGLAPVTRAGARPGDVVAVCGRLGWSAAGYALLAAGRAAPEPLIQAHRRPQPPYAAGPQASRLGATALVDVSDGLVQDLRHVAEASGVGIDLRADSLAAALAPLAEAAETLGADPLGWVLTGGEDHALAGCFPAAVRLPQPWQAVGTVAAGRGVTVDGRRYEGAGGWDHFG